MDAIHTIYVSVRYMYRRWHHTTHFDRICAWNTEKNHQIQTDILFHHVCVAAAAAAAVQSVTVKCLKTCVTGLLICI